MGTFKGINKIRVRDLGLSIKTLEELVTDTDEEIHVARIAGQLITIEKKPSQFGDKIDIMFRGIFAAINQITGQEYRAKVLWAPQMLEDTLLCDFVGNAEQPIAVAYDLHVSANPSTKSKPNASKYKFSISPVFPPKGDDFLGAMLAGKEPAAIEEKVEKTPKKK